MNDAPWHSKSKSGWKAFQRRNDLWVDGDPGLKTLGKVEALESKVRVSEKPPPPKPTSHGRQIDWIVIHHNGVPGRDVKNIRRSHKAMGFSDVGYHRIYLDGDRAGQVQDGRPPSKPGAHAKDFNDHSLGFCLIGNGDEGPFDDAQIAKLRADIQSDLKHYGLTADRVIGHREVNLYTGPNEHKTHKNCPGRHFDMEAFRASLALEPIV